MIFVPAPMPYVLSNGIPVKPRNLIESVAEECPKCGGRRAVRQDWRMVEGGFVLLKT